MPRLGSTTVTGTGVVAAGAGAATGEGAVTGLLRSAALFRAGTPLGVAAGFKAPGGWAGSGREISCPTSRMPRIAFPIGPSVGVWSVATLACRFTR